MRYRFLGATGMSVSEMALGTMMFGAMGNSDHADSIRIIQAAMDGGINFIDTADVYSAGECEEIVGKAITGRRDEVVLATKFGLPRGPANESGGSTRWIARAVEHSLRRLGTDHIDLYQMHRADPNTDIDETLGALSDLIHAGKVRAIGSSTFPAEQIVEAQWAAARGGLRRFTTEQPRYSLMNRGIEANMLPTAQRYRMGVLSYGPLGSGWLTGRGDPATGRRATFAPQVFDRSIPANAAKAEAVERLAAVADEAGMPLPHLATAFVVSHPAITSVIIGPRTMEQLQNSLGAADIDLGSDILDRIDEIVPPGVDVNPRDTVFADSPALTDPRLRRR